jgi:hypothetical protein
MSNASTEAVRCPDCGAANGATNANCWLCRRDLAIDARGVGVDAPASLRARAQPPAEIARRPQFALSTLMLIVTLLCICLGLVSIAPGLIVPLIAVVVPALVRTMVAARRLDERTGAATMENRIGAFLVSMGIVILTWIAGLFTFGVACFVTIWVACNGPAKYRDTAGVVFWAGLAGSILLMVILLRVTWPRRA